MYRFDESGFIVGFVCSFHESKIKIPLSNNEFLYIVVAIDVIKSCISMYEVGCTNIDCFYMVRNFGHIFSAHIKPVILALKLKLNEH